MNQRDKSVHRTILGGGLLIAPIAAFSASVMQALAMSFSFFFMTLLTVLSASLIPVKFPAALRILLYSVVGSLVYIPVGVLTVHLFPQISGGIYIPILSSALYLITSFQEIFPRNELWKSLIRNLISVPAAAVLTGALRELFGSASLLGFSLKYKPPLPMLLHPAGGLILLILLLTAISAFRRKEQQHADND